MLVIILIIIFILFFKYVISNHLRIDFASLFKRGFAKKDDKFRFVLLYWSSAEKEKLILL